MSECSSCGAVIEWALTVGNKPIPLDPGYQSNGNLVELDDGTFRTLGQRDAADARGRGQKLRRTHFATCPNAKKHRA